MTASPLVGRIHELDRLTNALDKAAHGQAAVVLVSGDAGIGKTRLISELAGHAREQGHAVMIGQCAELGDAVPYLPLADALRGAALDPSAPEALAEGLRKRQVLTRLLPDSAADGQHSVAGSGLTQQQLFGAVLGLLSELAAERPVLLVLEDLHWADRATRDLLTFLGRVLQRERICLVGTYRTDDLHRRHPLRPVIAELLRLPTVTGVDLPPLTAEEMTTHLKAPPGLIERIIERAEGNPFYGEELLAAGEEEGVPDALADVLLARAEKLSEVAQQVLRVAAVAGRRVDDDLIREVAGMEVATYEEAMREILASGMLVRDNAGYAFRHALLREAVYDDLLPGERTRLHTAFAERLAENPAERAYHHMASHDVEGALIASVEAGHEAERMGAPAVAHRHYEQALSLWDQAPEAGLTTGHDRVHIVLHSAAVASASGDLHRAVSHLRRVREVDPRPEVIERFAYYAFESESESAREAGLAAEEALRLVPAEPPSAMLARALATHALTLLWGDRHDESPGVAERAIEVARATGSVDAEVSALVTLARHAEFGGDDSDRLFAEAGDKARNVGDLAIALRASFHRARARFEGGDVRGALPLADDGVRLAYESGLEWSAYGTDLRFLQVLIHYANGDWDQAEALGGTFSPRVGNLAQARLSSFALFIEVARGRPIVEERLAGLARFWETDDLVAQTGRGLAAEHALFNGDVATALEHVYAAFEPLLPFEPVIIRLVATGLAVLGRDGGADAVRQGSDLIARAREAATTAPGSTRGELGPEGRAWLLRAEAEWRRLEGEDDPALWRQVVEAFGFGFVYEEARARHGLAMALLAQGERDEAEAEWGRAVEAARRLDAAPFLRELDELGRRGGFGPAPADGSLGLTGRELEVLRLVAAGRNNRDIAGELFISPKTASVHVSHILAKLGVASRTQAAAIAHREGLTRDR